jgi:hypothetical protein
MSRFGLLVLCLWLPLDEWSGLQLVLAFWLCSCKNQCYPIGLHASKECTIGWSEKLIFFFFLK